MPTLHANSPEEALIRFGHCVLASHVRLPHRSVGETALAVHTIAHFERRGEKRVVAELVSFEEYDRRRDVFRLHPAEPSQLC
jgi:Flp pilus assembly CpaF family ATPase